ncbi:MAG: hypothetical protein ACRCUT_06395, partial [Spirochaetota bacterium]
MKIFTHKRKIIKVLLGIAGIFIALALAEYAVLFFVVRGDFVKSSISSYFRDNFNKAVLFDSAAVSLDGSLTLENFVMAKESDFNDNVDLIRCPKVYIDLFLPKLLQKKVEVRKISFPGPVITLVKSSGVSYDDFVRRLLNIDNSTSYRVPPGLRNFSLEVKNASIMLKEIYSVEAVSIGLSETDAFVSMDDGILSLDIEGMVDIAKTDWLDRGSFSIKGTASFPEQGSSSASFENITFRIDDFDVSCLSPLIREKYVSGADCTGSASATCELKGLGNARSFSGKIELYGITCAQKINDSEQKNIVSDEK